MKCPSPEKGYTLIELIVVMFIIALAAGLVAASFGKSLPNAKLKGTVRELSALMHYAAGVAQLKGVDQEVVIDLDARSFQYKEKRRTFAEGVQVVVYDPFEGLKTRGTWSIFFYMEGGTSGGRVDIANEKRIFTITIDPVVGSSVQEGIVGGGR